MSPERCLEMIQLGMPEYIKELMAMAEVNSEAKEIIEELKGYLSEDQEWLRELRVFADL